MLNHILKEEKKHLKDEEAALKTNSVLLRWSTKKTSLHDTAAAVLSLENFKC